MNLSSVYLWWYSGKKGSILPIPVPERKRDFKRGDWKLVDWK